MLTYGNVGSMVFELDEENMTTELLYCESSPKSGFNHHSIALVPKISSSWIVLLGSISFFENIEAHDITGGLMATDIDLFGSTVQKLLHFAYRKTAAIKKRTDEKVAPMLLQTSMVLYRPK